MISGMENLAIAEQRVAIHYDPREIYSHWNPARNTRLEADGEHGSHWRKVLVTVDGDFAGSVSFSTEGDKDSGFGLCYGQRDQILGVPSEPGEQAAADFIARRYRKGRGY